MSRAMLMGAARADFMTFVVLAFDALYPGKPLKVNWHHRAIAAMLKEAEVSFQFRQIVTMPPRSLKSFMISVAFTAYLLGKNPALRILCVTYGDKLSEDLSEATQRLMTSDFYQQVFPATRLRTATKQRLTTTKGGMRFATSMGGAMTGFGGDWVILDDPMNASEAYSESARQRVKQDFDRALSSRVNDETQSRFILVMQRLHADDLAGHLLGTGDWTELKLQAQATERAWIDVGTRDFHVVEVGDLLHEARLPQDVLDRKRRQLGSVDFQSQFQQDPVPADGLYVRSKWLTYYEQLPDREEDRVIVSLDTATKTNPSNDYSVATVWLMKGGKHYLQDVWRDKVEYPALKHRIVALYHQHRADTLLIEDQGSGISLAQELTQVGMSVVPCKTPLGKLPRLIAALSQIEAGLMLLPKDAPWLGAFVSELLAFPNGRHDDQVDSMSQYFAWVRDLPPPMSFSYDFINPHDFDHSTLAGMLAARNWR